MASKDWATFVEFVAARSTALQHAAYLMVGDAGPAQDLVQEALVTTCGVWSRLRDRGAAEAYARKVITTTAMAWFRRRAWSAERPSDRRPDRLTPGHADQVTERAWLRQCLQQLPARQRIAIVLRYYEVLSEAQTAEAMDCAHRRAGRPQPPAGKLRLPRRMAGRHHASGHGRRSGKAQRHNVHMRRCYPDPQSGCRAAAGRTRRFRPRHAQRAMGQGVAPRALRFA